MSKSQSNAATEPRAKAPPKITLSSSRDIPFDKLLLSQSNVRRITAGVSIEQLAADIARRTLLQSLTVRPVLDEHGTETGMFEIPAGGRRYRALELLVRRKQLARTAPVPCVIRTEGLAEEDMPSDGWQMAFSIVGAGAVGVTALFRMAGAAPPDPGLERARDA